MNDVYSPTRDMNGWFYRGNSDKKPYDTQIGDPRLPSSRGMCAPTHMFAWCSGASVVTSGPGKTGFKEKKRVKNVERNNGTVKKKDDKLKNDKKQLDKTLEIGILILK